MTQAAPNEPDVLMQWAFHVRPQTSFEEDHWVAWYPDARWRVSAESKDAALKQLSEEYLRRVNAGEDDSDYSDAVRRAHLQQPIPGIYAMDAAAYSELRASQADLDTAFEDAERSRTSGPQRKAP